MLGGAGRMGNGEWGHGEWGHGRGFLHTQLSNNLAYMYVHSNQKSYQSIQVILLPKLSLFS